MVYHSYIESCAVCLCTCVDGATRIVTLFLLMVKAQVHLIQLLITTHRARATLHRHEKLLSHSSAAPCYTVLRTLVTQIYRFVKG
jgi:hypothetical protein